MGRKAARRKPGKQRPRAAPDPLQTPMPTFGDVVMMIQPAIHGPFGGRATHLMAAQAALFSALASCARIGPETAGGLMLAEALSGKVVLETRRGHARPVILFPVVLKAIRNCIKHRPVGAGPWLFVTCEGKQLHWSNLVRFLTRLGRRYGFRAGNMTERLFEFFDSFFGSHDEIFAVVALRRSKSRRREPDVDNEGVEAAALDEDLLRTVIEDHGLSGPAGRWIGARGITAAEATTRLFEVRRKLKTGNAEALRIDPVCIMLGSLEWPKKGQNKMRRELADEHFVHLEALRAEGRLTTGDEAFLLHTTSDWIKHRRTKLRQAAMTDEERATEAAWTAELPGLYLSRPRGETPDEFWKRMRPHAPVPESFTRIGLAGVLKRAGALGPRPRGRNDGPGVVMFG